MKDVMLHEFITANRTDIIRRCQEKAHHRLVAARSNAPIAEGVPMFLDQLVDELRRDTPARTVAITQAALQHGHDLFALDGGPDSICTVVNTPARFFTRNGFGSAVSVSGATMISPVVASTTSGRPQEWQGNGTALSTWL